MFVHLLQNSWLRHDRVKLALYVNVNINSDRLIDCSVH